MLFRHIANGQTAALVDTHDRRVLRAHMRVVVRRGDSLWAIARRHGVDVHQLASMNGLQPEDTLRAGQHLRLVSTAAAETGTGITAASAPTIATGTAHTRKVTYIVRAGDTLARIARVFQVTVAQLVSWNSLEQTAIAPGQHLLIRVASR